ncbi:hypothetical protein MIND_00674000 [Mycena indigotica]|uniref:F-box domain-containing protein n=1 Tax=Mycena indigotica TaxID=2126181 RepID=A0A8H6SJZ3_9AGAR|nr:uncharacterized protein MIND_00674000 [Mycena indigotica]KAF7301100.1 hypothetical protein MIND_00674000 [Mycena indigotica]
MHWPNSRIFYDILAQSASPGFAIHAQSLLEAAEEQLARTTAQSNLLSPLPGHQQLVARIAALKYAVAPVRKLPADILLEIFRIVADDLLIPFYYINWYSNRHFRPAFRLASVCSYWRQLMSTAPRLWPTSMTLQFSRFGCSPQYLDVAKTLLQRSNPYSLDITVDGRGLNVEPSLALHVIFVAMNVASRWQRISMDCDIVPFLRAARTPGPLIHLTEINLHNLNWDETDEPSAFFLDAPKLTRVSLRTSHATKLLLPWSQLTKLQLEGVESPGFLAVLEQCISVVNLRLVGYICDEDVIAPSALSTIVSLVHLSNLKLSVTEDHCTFDPLFRHFTFPSLINLTLNAPGADDTPEIGESFPSFLARCSALSDLSISCFDMNETALSDILLNIPSLTSLTLAACFYCVDNAFFERLTYRPTDLVPPAPCLQRLHLDGVNDRYSQDVVLAMVCSRWWTDDALRLPAPRVARWQNIYICGRDPPEVVLSDAFKAAMAELRAEGLVFEVEEYEETHGDN